MLDHNCLLTVPWHMHMVAGELRSVRFCPKTGSIGLLADNFGILKLKT